MKKADKLFFEISEGKNSIVVELLEAPFKNSDLDWDKNYIRTKVTITIDTFYLQFETQFMTIDFEIFKRDLKRIYEDFNGTAIFKHLDYHLELLINGEGGAYFSTERLENEMNTLKFPFSRIQILSLVKQLEKITELFPIIGNEFRITAETPKPNENKPIQSTRVLLDRYPVQGLAMVND